MTTNTQSIPEKWYMEVTEENFEIAKKWQQHKGNVSGLRIGYVLLSKHHEDDSYYYAMCLNLFLKRKGKYYVNYTEITFKQFLAIAERDGIMEKQMQQVPTTIEPAIIIDTPLKDVVNQPAHYTGGKVECIEAIEVATDSLSGLDAVCTANVIKYVWRWKHKNGVEDLKKAKWYLERLITKLENDRAGN